METYYWKNIKYLIWKNVSPVNLIWVGWNLLIEVTILPVLIWIKLYKIGWYYWWVNHSIWFAIYGGALIWLTIMSLIIYSEKVNLKYNILNG